LKVAKGYNVDWITDFSNLQYTAEYSSIQVPEKVQLTKSSNNFGF